MTDQRQVFKVIGVVSGIMLGLLLLFGVAGFLVLRHFDDQLDGRWTSAALTPSLARDLYGIERLPKEVLRTEQREGGFQDAIYEALLRVPPGSEAEFMTANGLTRAPDEQGSGASDEFEVRIREIASPHGVMRETPLAGMRDAHLADGGQVTEYRHISVLEFDDQVWLAFEGFDT